MSTLELSGTVVSCVSDVIRGTAGEAIRSVLPLLLGSESPVSILGLSEAVMSCVFEGTAVEVIRSEVWCLSFEDDEDVRCRLLGLEESASASLSKTE